MKIAIAGATGNIGSRVAKQISLKGGIPVLLGQNLERLNQMNILNSITRVTDLSDTEQVTASTQDVDALFWMVPPVLTVPSLKEWYTQVTAAGIAAVQQHKIERVVLISSLGAGAGEHLGTVSYAGDMEKAFDLLNANVLALRPGYFMENMLTQAQRIKFGNEFSFTYDIEHDLPWISTDDIGDTAAKYLLNSKWAGHWKLNLMGPENITSQDVALKISRVLDLQVKYKQQTIAEASNELAGFGANAVVCKELAELFIALGDADGAYATPRTAEAFTPTTLEEFVKRKLVPLLNSSN